MFENPGGNPLLGAVAEEGLPQRLAVFLKICQCISYLHEQLMPPAPIQAASICCVKLAGEPTAKGPDKRASKERTTILEPKLPGLLAPWLAGQGDDQTTRDHVSDLGAVLKAILQSSKNPLPKEKSRDLKAITAKATQGDKSKRYGQVNGLSDDIRHLLANRPVSALPAAKLYVFRKFARRNGRWFFPLLALVLLLLAGLLFVVWLGSQYYLSTQDHTVVVRWGHPGFPGVPGVGRIIAGTEYDLGQFREPWIFHENRLGGFWPLRHGGLPAWTPQILATLGDTDAGLALWRLGRRQQAIQRLGNGIEAGQAAAARALGYLLLHTPQALDEALPLLLNGLRGTDPVHHEVLEVLADFGALHPESTPEVTARLRQQWRECMASQSKGTLPLAIAEAIGALEPSGTRTQSRLISLLPHARNGPDFNNLARALIPVLTAGEPAAERLLAAWLAGGSEDAAMPQAGQGESYRLFADLAVAQQAGKPVGPLVFDAALSHSSIRVQLLTLEAIPAFADGSLLISNRIVTALLEGLAGSEPKVRMAARNTIRALLPDPPALAPALVGRLPRLLQDSATADRDQILVLLGDLYHQGGFPAEALFKLGFDHLKDRDPAVRVAAYRTIARLPPSWTSLPPILAALRQTLRSEPEPEVREAALAFISVLTTQDPIAVVSLLQLAFGDPDAGIRDQAIQLIHQLTCYEKLDFDSVASLLTEALEDPTQGVRVRAADILLLNADRVTIDLEPALSIFAQNFIPEEMHWYEPRFQAEWFGHGTPAAASLLAHGLIPFAVEASDLGTQWLAQFFYHLGRQHPPALADVVKAAIAIVVHPQAGERLIQNMSNVPLGLGDMPPIRIQSALPHLKPLLNDPSPQIRRATVEAVSLLTRGNSETALQGCDLLMDSLADPIPKVSTLAVRALGWLGRAHEAAAWEILPHLGKTRFRAYPHRCRSAAIACELIAIYGDQPAETQARTQRRAIFSKYDSCFGLTQIQRRGQQINQWGIQ